MPDDDPHPTDGRHCPNCGRLIDITEPHVVIAVGTYAHPPRPLRVLAVEHLVCPQVRPAPATSGLGPSGWSFGGNDVQTLTAHPPADTRRRVCGECGDGWPCEPARDAVGAGAATVRATGVTYVTTRRVPLCGVEGRPAFEQPATGEHYTRDGYDPLRTDDGGHL